MSTRRYYLVPLAAGVLLLVGFIALYTTQPASAQCGSQASSCKTCHETNNQKPVNNDGNGWHTGHAFGDFCYSCHGGNNQSMDKAESHLGMVPPMSDIKTSCAGCHPDDLNARAQKYADVLGVSLGSAPAQPTPTAAPAAAPAATTAPAAAPISPAPVMVTAAQEVAIDYVARYQGETPVNWGDVTLVVLIVVTLLGGGAFIFWNERKLRGLPGFSLLKPQTPPAPGEAPKVPGYSDEVASLLPHIARLDPVGLHALKRILAKPDQANEMLHSLSHLDPELIHRLRTLDKDSRSLLLALAGD